jgi:hypothetical protein
VQPEEVIQVRAVIVLCDVNELLLLGLQEEVSETDAWRRNVSHRILHLVDAEAVNVELASGLDGVMEEGNGKI